MLPRGVTEKNHAEIRDKFLMLLLAEGVDVTGAWEDWHLEATGATKAQIWGSERTSIYDQDLEWRLRYRGKDATATELDSLYGGRAKPEDILQAPTFLKKVEATESSGRYTMRNFIGYEWERDEDVGEAPIMRPERKKSIIRYKCEKCGHIFTQGRRFKHEMTHKIDGGRLVFLEATTE